MPVERLEATTRLPVPHCQNRQNESKIVKQHTAPCFDRLLAVEPNSPPIYRVLTMHQDGIARPSRSTLQMRASCEALQEVLNTLEALSERRTIALPALPIIDTKQRDSSHRDTPTELEVLDAIALLRILSSSGAPVTQKGPRVGGELA